MYLPIYNLVFQNLPSNIAETQKVYHIIGSFTLLNGEEKIKNQCLTQSQNTIKIVNKISCKITNKDGENEK